MEFINALLTSYLISRSECSMGIWEERGLGCKFWCIILRCALIVFCAFCMLTDLLSLDLFCPERCVLKLSILSVLLPIFPCISSSFCYIKVVAVLFGTYLFRTIISTLQIVILAFKMSSLSFLVFCSLTGPQPDIKLITPTFILLMFAWYTLTYPYILPFPTPMYHRELGLALWDNLKHFSFNRLVILIYIYLYDIRLVLHMSCFM